jgi:glutamate synthase domain-containing protein 3
VRAVVEGVGDHACEYMTGGKAVIRPHRTQLRGRHERRHRLRARRSGDFATRCNTEMVDLERLEDPEEILELHDMIQNHVEYTGAVRRAIACWSLER